MSSPIPTPEAEILFVVAGTYRTPGPIEGHRSDTYRDHETNERWFSECTAASQLFAQVEVAAATNGLRAQRANNSSTGSQRHFDGGMMNYASAGLTVAGGLAGIAAVLKALQPSLVAWIRAIAPYLA